MNSVCLGVGCDYASIHNFIKTNALTGAPWRNMEEGASETIRSTVYVGLIGPTPYYAKLALAFIATRLGITTAGRCP